MTDCERLFGWLVGWLDGLYFIAGCCGWLAK